MRQSEVIAALSHALDMTEGHPVGQAERTCLIGMRLARELRLDGRPSYALYYALLLKDVGCSSSAARMCELFGTDDIALKTHGKLVDWTKPVAGRALHLPARPGGWADRPRPAHALGAALARGRGQGDRRDALRPRRRDRPEPRLPRREADAVWALDEYWDGRGQPYGMAGDEIPLLARIACLSQTAEVFFATHGLAAAQEMVRERRGRWFDPQVADVLLAIGARGPAVERSRERRRAALVLALEPADRVLVLDDAGIDRICEAFADVIDAKSPFTARHSRGVATYAGLIGEQLGFARAAAARAAPRRDAARHRQARHPEHDPRQARASSTDEEFARIRLHPAFTESILAGIPAFAGFAAIAAAHHERLDGRGYHRGVPAGDLP